MLTGPGDRGTPRPSPPITCQTGTRRARRIWLKSAGLGNAKRTRGWTLNEPRPTLGYYVNPVIRSPSGLSKRPREYEVRQTALIHSLGNRHSRSRLPLRPYTLFITLGESGYRADMANYDEVARLMDGDTRKGECRETAPDANGHVGSHLCSDEDSIALQVQGPPVLGPHPRLPVVGAMERPAKQSSRASQPHSAA